MKATLMNSIGAKYYYMRNILHDWPDEQCKQILSNLKPALRKGHSRILLNEIIIPDVGSGWFETGVDMIMLNCHSAQERREKHWVELVDSLEHVFSTARGTKADAAIINEHAQACKG